MLTFPKALQLHSLDQVLLLSRRQKVDRIELFQITSATLPSFKGWPHLVIVVESVHKRRRACQERLGRRMVPTAHDCSQGAAHRLVQLLGRLLREFVEVGLCPRSTVNHESRFEVFLTHLIRKSWCQLSNIFGGHILPCSGKILKPRAL